MGGADVATEYQWPPLPSVDVIEDPTERERKHDTCVVLYETFVPLCAGLGYLPCSVWKGWGYLVAEMADATGFEGDFAEWVVNGPKHDPSLHFTIGSFINEIQEALTILIKDGWIELFQVDGWPCLRPTGGWNEIASYFDEGELPDRLADIEIANQNARYKDYLSSPEWQERRKIKLAEAGYRCQLCNSPKRLQVHHRTYERRGNEAMRDLIVLCADCHGRFHDKIGGHQ